MILNKRLLRAFALLLFVCTVISFMVMQYHHSEKLTHYRNLGSNLYSNLKYYNQDSNSSTASDNDLLKDKNIDGAGELQEDEDNFNEKFQNEIPQSLNNKANSKHKIMTPKEIKEKLTFKSSFPESATPQEIVDENFKYYQEIYSKKIDEPKGMKLTYKKPGQLDYKLANATLLTLVRNSELEAILTTIEQIEKTFNSVYNYPYHFISEEPFTEEFKSEVENLCSGEVFYSLIPFEMWNRPESIDHKKLVQGIKKLTDNKVQYADMDSYHNMCRFNSGIFYNLKELQNYKYYWRFEPGTNYYCKVEYDLFKFMEDNDLTYGFTISLYDNPLTVETLWEKTMKFVNKHPEYVHPNGAFQWLTENVQNPLNTQGAGGYSTCHFWSNFEIGDMDFYRGEAYTKWFEMLEEEGGFYYERWGDAPVHSVGLGLFEDKKKIHWFRDVCYFHSPYFNCANSPKNLGGCEPGYFAPDDVLDQNCLSNWIKYEMDAEDMAKY